MNAMRKSAWVIVLMGMVAGCGETEPAASDSPPPKLISPAADAKPVTPDKPPAASDSKPGEMKTVEDPPAVEGPKADNAKSSTGAVKLTAEELTAIKELPAAEQAAAIQQAVCPVSAEHLGSMEKPVKVTAEGRTFYLCCGSCQKELKADPKGVIAKLDKK
jgi:YHS domain-containing protein